MIYIFILVDSFVGKGKKHGQIIRTIRIFFAKIGSVSGNAGISRDIDVHINVRCNDHPGMFWFVRAIPESADK